jgi:general L-amino acid transport system substrate-binding protein
LRRNGTLGRFGLPDAQGQLDRSRQSISAARSRPAIFNDPTKVKFVALTAKDRFTALQSATSTCWCATRPGPLARHLARPELHRRSTTIDGQGFMVRKALKVNSALELNDAAVCVQQGTTTELNLADYFRANKMKLKTVTFASADEAIKAYDSGRCDAFTTDASGLYAERPAPRQVRRPHRAPEIISKEPLGPSVRHGDDQWFDIVKWTHYAHADRRGARQSPRPKVDEQMKSDQIPDGGSALVSAPRQLRERARPDQGTGPIASTSMSGTTARSFEKNVGQRLQPHQDRAAGINALWTKVGLQYAPPIR